MKKQLSITLFSISCFCCALSATAAPNIQPGLWEMEVDIASKSGQIEAAMKQAKQMLANMPPEQQKMVKDMMKQQGISMDFGGRTIQVCMTQEQIDNFDLPQANDDCSQQFTQVNDSRFKSTMNCPAQNMSGEGEFVINNDKSFEGSIAMNMDFNGQPDTMTMSQRGTWLQEDCGDIAP